MSQLMSKASPALQSAQNSDAARLRSLVRPANVMAAITPITTGARAAGPNATIAPAARPAAGQNAATPSGVVSKLKLRRMARKEAMPTATARATAAMEDVRRQASAAVPSDG